MKVEKIITNEVYLEEKSAALCVIFELVLKSTQPLNSRKKLNYCGSEALQKNISR